MRAKILCLTQFLSLCHDEIVLVKCLWILGDHLSVDCDVPSFWVSGLQGAFDDSIIQSPNGEPLTLGKLCELDIDVEFRLQFVA